MFDVEVCLFKNQI